MNHRTDAGFVSGRCKIAVAQSRCQLSGADVTVTRHAKFSATRTILLRGRNNKGDFTPNCLSCMRPSPCTPVSRARWIFYTSKFKEGNLIAVSRSSTKFVPADLILAAYTYSCTREIKELGWKERSCVPRSRFPIKTINQLVHLLENPFLRKSLSRTF